MSIKIYATGKRKTAIAKVWIYNGSGNITINGKEFDKWILGRKTFEIKLKTPLVMTKQLNSLDIKILVFGGGYSAQVDAIVNAISKSLVKYEESFRGILKPVKFLRRDSRVVERKKPGKKKARKSPQFSKR